MTTKEIISEIIKEQSQIIGDQLAKFVAQNSGVIEFTETNEITIIEAHQETAVQKISKSYEQLFGQASFEVCMSVIRKYPASQTTDTPVTPAR